MSSWITGGGPAKDRYDKARALDPALVLGFIAATQPKLWQSLSAVHGEETGKTVKRISKNVWESKNKMKKLSYAGLIIGCILLGGVFHHFYVKTRLNDYLVDAATQNYVNEIDIRCQTLLLARQNNIPKLISLNEESLASEILALSMAIEKPLDSGLKRQIQLAENYYTLYGSHKTNSAIDEDVKNNLQKILTFSP